VAHGMIKSNRVESVLAEVKRREAEKQAIFIERWYSDQARELLREAIKKF
jgi:hypothetical protein